MVLIDEYEGIPMELNNLHGNILRVERSPFSNNVKYYMMKVPSGLHFNEAYPAYKFYMEFLEIFLMFNLLRAEASLVGLLAIYQAKEDMRLKVNNIAIADPYTCMRTTCNSKKAWRL